MLLIPAVLLALALLVRDPLGKVLSLGEPHGFYAALFPHWLLIGFFTLFTGLAFLASVVGLVRFWRAMKSADEKAGRSFPAVGIGTSIIQVLKSIISHRKFVHCQEEEMGASVGTEAIISPRTTHLLVFYGFLSLFAVTVWAVLDLYLMPLLGIRSFYPFPLIHPVKIVANLGCLVLLVGGALALRDRWNNRKIVGFNTAFDWIFLGELLAVGLTGLVTEILRFAAEPGEGTGLQYPAYAIYFVHLVLVFALLVYLPYSKFSHLLYRTTALVYAEYFGRNKKGP
jgi:quinone-modifying oxidoreductase subunit QmoC